MTSVRLPENLEAKLTALAYHTKRTKSYFITEALSRYLEDVEDYTIAVDRITRPGRKLLSTKDVLKQLDE